MALWFTAGTHFGGHRAINLHRRPLAGVAEMDEALISERNAVDGPADEVWYLGDFAPQPADAAALLGSDGT